MKSLSSVLCLFLLLGVSCSENDNGEAGRRPGTDKVEVVLPIADSFGETANYSAENSSEHDMPITRTLILGDGGLDKVGWAETDEVSLWAAAEGTADYILNGETFTYYSPIQGNALFTATIPEMAAGIYNYYGAYPVPNSVSSTQVTYTLAAEQSGAYDGTQDIMLARPASGSELTENTPASAARLSFAHKCHVLRIQVPTGRNKWGIGIRKLRIKFPAEVVGDLQFDVTNPDAVPVFTNGSNTVTLNLVRPLDESEEDASDGNYVWVFVRPGVQLTGNLEFTAFSAEGYQSETISTPISKTLAEGRITPVTMTIPKELPVTYLDFSIVGNNLGEDIQKLHITAPEGSTFRNGSTSQQFTVNAENKYIIGFYNTVDGRANGNQIRTGTTTFTFESENALIPEKRVIGDFTLEGHTEKTLTGPYLLSEDFSRLNQDFSNNEGTTGVNDPAAIWLDSYGISGWSAARVGGKAGTSVRIVGHREGGMWIFADYEARMDSAPLSGLKPGVTVKIQISFNYSGSTNKGAPKFRYGISTGTGAISGANADIEKQVGDISATTNGSYDRVDQSITPFTTDATNATRLSWVCYGSDGGFSGSYFYYIYLDNIKVQIVK